MAAPRRRPLVPFFLLLPIFLLLLFLHLSSNPAIPLSNSNPHSNPNPRHFSLLIKLLAYDRPDPLRRCLRSLAGADYSGDRVPLHILLDHPSNSSAGEKLATSHQILAIVDAFRWPHGEKRIHYRTANAGLQAQWLEAWWPASDDEFAFVVEDDLEVSPLYYRFLKRVVMRYYYDPENYSPYVFGASLQRPRFVAGKHGNKIQLDSGTRLFLYQMVGTWGQLLFPKPWKEFRLWYDEQKAGGIKPILQGMKTTGWYKKMGERIWTPWFIKFIHSRGYFNIYTNFLKERALSISHRDAGVNYGRNVGPDSTLLDKNNLDLNLWELQPLRSLKWYNFCFSEVLAGRVARSFSELPFVLNSVQKRKTIVLISLYAVETRIARNLICHLEKVGVQNYIFIGENSEFLADLARRGYPVVDLSKLLHSIKMKSLGNSDDFVKEILVKSYVIKSCLDLGYNLWVVDGNMVLFVSDLVEPSDQSLDFFTAEAMDVMFIRNSRHSKETWDDHFTSILVERGKSLMSNKAVSLKHKSFLHVIAEALQNRSSMRLGKLMEWTTAVELGFKGFNSSSLDGQNKMVFWPRSMALDSVQRQLESTNLWLIDKDSSCNAVVCHRK